MPKRVITTATYLGNAQDIFLEALSFSEMADAMSKIARYKGLANQTAQQGKTYKVDITTLKIFKTKGYEMLIELLDKEACILQSREKGGAIKTWDHHLSIRQKGEMAIWTDDVTIEAGLMTPFTARFGAYIYKKRHQHRQALSIETKIIPITV